MIYFVQYFTYFALILYYRSSGHVVSECSFALGNIHFRGELIHLFTYTGIIINNLRFSFILYTKFFVSPHILTSFGAFYGSFTRSRDDDITAKMEVNRSVVRKYSFSQ